MTTLDVYRRACRNGEPYASIEKAWAALSDVEREWVRFAGRGGRVSPASELGLKSGPVGAEE